MIAETDQIAFATKLLETILVPTACGPESDAAMKTAELLAAVFDSGTVLLHAS